MFTLIFKWCVSKHLKLFHCKLYPFPIGNCALVNIDVNRTGKFSNTLFFIIRHAYRSCYKFLKLYLKWQSISIPHFISHDTDISPKIFFSLPPGCLHDRESCRKFGVKQIIIRGYELLHHQPQFSTCSAHDERFMAKVNWPVIRLQLWLQSSAEILSIRITFVNSQCISSKGEVHGSG